MFNMPIVPLILLGVPIITGLACLAAGSKRIINSINGCGAAITLVLGLLVSGQVFSHGTIRGGKSVLYIDALSAFLVGVVVLITFLAALYSIVYLGREEEEGVIGVKQLSRYYLLYHLFVFTMLTSLMVNNLGVLWVAIEATTLASALLVGFYNKETSLEAAWKYIIICTVGITFALFGIILAYYSSIRVLGDVSDALNWTTLLGVSRQLDPSLMKLAFIFILIGFGTKAGLAPMHTWLPDAHSQAPSPISAVLSGVLLNCAMYGIIRFHIIATGCLGEGFSGNLFIIFGLISVGLAIPFIAVQTELKRLLAYSSVEHMGVIALGLGFGGRLGYYGAMLHLLNHAVAKSLMFFTAGNLTQKYKTGKMAKMTGALQNMPVTGPVLLAGALAISGTPPFNVFVSEFTIAAAGIKQGHMVTSVFMLFFLALIFAGITYQIGRIALGSCRSSQPSGELNKWTGVILALPLAFVLVLGFYMPPFLDHMLNQVVNVLQGRL
ncbi:MAG TPA: hydrogenase 4 subunit F [Bacillota bacterium]|nr:hydrogenase 4 subunit F [Bacillota bacterium]